MVLLGTSIIIASLSIFVFQWRSTIWRSWIRRLPFVKDEAPLNSNHAPPRIENKSQKRSSRGTSPSSNILDTPAGNEAASSPSTVSQCSVPLTVSAPDPPTTPKALSGSTLTRQLNDEKIPRDSKEPSSIPELPPSLLMPPPPRPSKPVQTAKTTPSRNTLQPHQVKAPSNSLRPPTLSPSPNRTASLAPNPRSAPTSLPTTSTLPTASRPRKKVILSPGHSPLDWAHLTATSPSHELSGVPSLQRVTSTQLKAMDGRKGRPAWSVYKGRVYNIGKYLPFHPGGEGELMRGAGKDAGTLFEEVHPWVNWESMMGSCMVGILVGETEMARSNEMDDMD